MNRYITIYEASEKYERTEDNFRSQALKYKSKHGSYPKWYTKHKGKYMIDTYEYEYKTNLERIAWIYATDKLYWILSDTIGKSNLELSRVLSSMGKRSVDVWQVFLNNSLFNVPPEFVGDKKKSMRLEFVQLGTRLIYNLIKSGDLDHIRYNIKH